MVAGPGRNADVGDVVLHRNRRHQRLRSVSAGHADDVGATCTARVASSQRSSPGASSNGSMLRFRASSDELKRSALPPPNED